jgi:hypothetical protein
MQVLGGHAGQATSKLRRSHVGAYLGHAVLFAVCKIRLFATHLLSPLLTFQLTLASMVPFMRPGVLLRVFLPNQDLKYATLGGVLSADL